MTDDQDHSTPQSPDDAIFAQAVSWLTRLRERDADAAAFQAWLAADPRHEAAFAEAECLWGRLELPARKLADTEIGRTRTARRQRPLRGLAAAAALTVVAPADPRGTTAAPLRGAAARSAMKPPSERASTALLNGPSEL